MSAATAEHEPARRPTMPVAARLTDTWAVRVTATWHDHTFEEICPSGTPLRVGVDHLLSLPRHPAGGALVEGTWRSPQQIVLMLPSGQTYTLDTTNALSMDVGDSITMRFDLVRQFPLRRTGALGWRLGMTWAVMFATLTLLFQTAATVSMLTCPAMLIPMHFFPQVAGPYDRMCVDHSQAGAGGSAVTAEFLARLLRKDLDGDSEDGVVQLDPNRPAGRPGDSYYMPSGAKGPATALGGAAEVSATPRKAPPKRNGGGAGRPKHTRPGVAPAPNGAPMAASKVDDTTPEGNGGDKSGDPNEPSSPGTTASKQGWGLEDWYDVSDSEHDKDEIARTLDTARKVLRIDPNDVNALQILSYYQYLGEDFDGALATYDKILRIEPEQAAGYNNKALVFKRQKKYQEEEALYRQALQMDPMDTTVMNNLGVNLAHQGRFDEAIKQMDEIALLDPENPYADLHRAKIWAAKGELEKSYEMLERALKGMQALDTLHAIEFRQDIRVDPAFDQIRGSARFHEIMTRYYGKNSPLLDGH